MQVLWTRENVEQRTGLGRSAIYVLMGREEFPRPIKMGRKKVMWLASDIEAWIQGRIAARDADTKERA